MKRILCLVLVSVLAVFTFAGFTKNNAEKNEGETETVLTSAKKDAIIVEAKTDKSKTQSSSNQIPKNKDDCDTALYQPITGSHIKELISFENGDVLVVRQKSISFYDAKSQKETASVKIPDADMFFFQKLDSALVQFNQWNGEYIIYDTKLNKLKEGRFDFIRNDDDSTYTLCFSHDAKKFVYTQVEKVEEAIYDEKVYVSDIDLKNKKEIASFRYNFKDNNNAYTVGEVLGISSIYSFKDDVILFSGGYVISNDGDCVSCVGTMTLDGKLDIFASGDFVSANINHNGITESVISEDRTTVKYCLDGNKGLKKFTFETPRESRYSYLSESGKYIYSEVSSEDESLVTVKVYETETGKLIFKNTYRKFDENYNRTYMSFEICESGDFALVNKFNSIEKIKLS